jgi:hypothetical protein
LNISGLNLSNVEASSECSGRVVGLVEEVLESSDGEILMLLVDLSENDGSKRSVALDGSFLLSLVILNLILN